MKKQAFMVLTTLSLFVALAAVSVNAQSNNLKVNIPFEFSAGNKVLPAGEYTVSRINQGGLMIRSVDCSAIVMFFTHPTRARTTPAQSALDFNRYGDQYFLSKIWTAGEDNGRGVSESRAERELIRATSASVKDASARQIVSISAHR